MHFRKGISQEIYLNRQIFVGNYIFEKSPKGCFCFFFVCLFVCFCFCCCFCFLLFVFVFCFVLVWFVLFCFLFCFVLFCFVFCPNFISTRVKISLGKNHQKICKTFHIHVSMECFKSLMTQMEISPFNTFSGYSCIGMYVFSMICVNIVL